MPGGTGCAASADPSVPAHPQYSRALPARPSCRTPNETTAYTEGVPNPHDVGTMSARCLIAAVGQRSRMHLVQSQPLAMVRPDISRLSQETLAILGVGVALAALTLTSIAGVRGEIRAVRDELRDVRAEVRADRQVFQEQILRLTEQQGELGGQIEIIRDQLAAGG